MKNFFENKTWDDYLIAGVFVLIIGGLALFFIGFYFGFNPVLPNGGNDGALFNEKLSVHKIVSGKAFAGTMSVIGLNGDYNLFSLAGAIDPSFGAMYAMVVVSILGFSFMMLGFAIVLTVIIVGFIWEMVMKKKQRKAS